MGEYERGLTVAGPVVNRSLNEVVKKWMGKEPGGALAWAEKNLDDEKRTDVIASAASVWAQNDWPAVEKWYQRLPGEMRSRAVSRLAQIFASIDADATIEWLGTLRGPEATMARAVVMVEAPSSRTRSIIEGASDEAERLALLTRYTKYAHTVDLSDVKWLVEMPEIETPELSASLRSAFENVAHETPQALLDWAPTVELEDVRADAYLSVAKAWAGADLPRARSVLSGAVLPDALRQDRS